jgi:hypothetical protein
MFVFIIYANLSFGDIETHKYPLSWFEPSIIYLFSHFIYLL